MFLLQSEYSIDAAHFLAGYQGKCGNIHGHRWRILVQVSGEELSEEEQDRGMVLDFGKLKEDLKSVADVFDHMFIVEKGTLKPATCDALKAEAFQICWVDFRPTAENFSKYFYQKLVSLGYTVKEVTVYETPNNCAVYCEE